MWGVVVPATAAGGLALVRGIQILASGCETVTFDGSGRVGGRSLTLTWTCLDNGSGFGDPIGGTVAGIGLLILGLLGLTSILWIPSLAAFFTGLKNWRKSPVASQRRPILDPVTANYRHHVDRGIRMWMEQEGANASGTGQLMTVRDVPDAVVLTLHRVAYLRVLADLGRNAKGRNARQRQAQLRQRYFTVQYEWFLLANVAERTGRNQEELWNAMRINMPEDCRTPLEILTSRSTAESQLGRPPLALLDSLTTSTGPSS